MNQEKQTFKLKSNYKPAGGQVEAIKKLVAGIKSKNEHSTQTLLGVTGSGKTFTMANVIEQINKPTLVIAHNKTLAAQLYEEFREFFPENRVEYFVSYYDYYQPESYLPAKDQYIEKDSAVNPRIEMMRHATTASLRSRNDVIVIATVSCIYGLGNPKNYVNKGLELTKKQKINRKEIIKALVGMVYERNDTELLPGRFRVKGDTIDLVPSYQNNIVRIELFGDEVETIKEIDRNNGDILQELPYFYIYPATHYVIAEEEFDTAIEDIKLQLKEDLSRIDDDLIRHRLKQRTQYDMEMIKETGSCKGIENYSRHFDGRKAGVKSFCLLDYFKENFLIIVDESHRTIPQIGGMYEGDKSRKKNLIDFGFRLTSAYDNRPLQFHEFEEYLNKNHTVFVSATPAKYEYAKSEQFVEQIIRPTGLIDPVVEIRPAEGQIKDVIKEIERTIKEGDRVLLTVMTKRLAEELADYLGEQKIKTRYLHSEIDTFERTEIIRELRLGTYDCLVGINLLREGIDIPELGFIGILDADKEGFLRDSKSLIQIIGRAARNSKSKVILYADKKTASIEEAVKETERRRTIQMAYNKQHGITPKTIIKPIKDKVVEITDVKSIPKAEIPNMIIALEAAMKESAELLDFEKAIAFREKISKLSKRMNEKI